VIYCTDIDRAQQPRQIGLAALPVPPDLGDDYWVGAQLYPAFLGNAPSDPAGSMCQRAGWPGGSGTGWWYLTSW
jgi:hypothetical protein